MGNVLQGLIPPLALPDWFGQMMNGDAARPIAAPRARPARNHQMVLRNHRRAIEDFEMNPVPVLLEAPRRLLLNNEPDDAIVVEHDPQRGMVVDAPIRRRRNFRGDLGGPAPRRRRAENDRHGFADFNQEQIDAQVEHWRFQFREDAVRRELLEELFRPDEPIQRHMLVFAADHLFDDEDEDAREDHQEGRDFINIHFAERFARRQRRADIEYYFALGRELNKKIECEFCKNHAGARVFLAHLQKCSKATEHFRQKEISIQQHLSSTWSFHYALYKLRERLEIQYLQVWANRSRIFDLECELCQTPEIHETEFCIEDHQREVFIRYANQIAAAVLAHFEQYLESAKQTAVEEAALKHPFCFETLDGWLGDGEPTDLQTEHNRQAAWAEYKQNSANATLEKERYIEEQTKKNTEAYSARKMSVDAKVESMADSIAAYLRDAKTTNDLPALIAKRKAKMIDKWVPTAQDDSLTEPHNWNMMDGLRV